MNEQLEQQAWRSLIEWIVEYRGEDVAHAWAWNCTPYPFGHPNQEQIENGLAIAIGTLNIGELMARCEREMFEALETYKEEHA